MTTDWVGLIDEWAARFFEELDYRTEAQNALRFAKQMESLEGITVSIPRLNLTNRGVLTTNWVLGELLKMALPVSQQAYVPGCVACLSPAVCCARLH